MKLMTGKYSVGTALTESYKPKLLLQHIFTYIIFSVVLLAYFLGPPQITNGNPKDL